GSVVIPPNFMKHNPSSKSEKRSRSLSNASVATTNGDGRFRAPRNPKPRRTSPARSGNTLFAAKPAISTRDVVPSVTEGFPSRTIRHERNARRAYPRASATIPARTRLLLAPADARSTSERLMLRTIANTAAALTTTPRSVFAYLRMQGHACLRSAQKIAARTMAQHFTYQVQRALFNLCVNTADVFACNSNP